MKKITFYCFFCLFGCNVVKAQVPKDLPAIEVIIAGHKSIWKKLDERNNNEKKNLLLKAKVRQIADEYHGVRENLSKRIEFSYNMLAFTKDAADITKLLSDNTKLIAEYIRLVASNMRNTPDLYEYFMNYYNAIEDEIKGIKGLVASTLVMRSNYEERFLAIRNIKNSLLRIQWMIERVLWLSRGSVLMGRSSGKAWIEILQSEEIQKYGRKLSREVVNSYSR